MKSLTPSIVRIKRITCTTEAGSFKKLDIESAAKLLLNLGGVINPLILMRTGIEDYHLINGDFEYQAALRAMEIDPQHKTINAFIVENEEEKEIYQKQIEVFRSRTVSPSSSAASTENTSDVEQHAEEDTKEVEDSNDPAPVSMGARKMSKARLSKARMEILQCLGKGMTSAKEIAAYLEKKISAVRQLLSKMLGNCTITRISRGHYMLLDAPSI